MGIVSCRYPVNIVPEPGQKEPGADSTGPLSLWFWHIITGLIRGLRLANERWSYIVMMSLFGWVQD